MLVLNRDLELNECPYHDHMLMESATKVIHKCGGKFSEGSWEVWGIKGLDLSFASTHSSGRVSSEEPVISGMHAYLSHAMLALAEDLDIELVAYDIR